MRQNSMFYSGTILLLASLALMGCPKKAEIAVTQETQKGELSSTATASRKGEVKTNEVSPANPAGKEESTERSASASAGMQPIHFDYDKAFIRDDARRVLTANAQWLKANPTTKIEIEGNCDERGTSEYNQALGQRRAVAAKKYLGAMGVSTTRISLISYGKEKPVCTEKNDDCWRKNRRDDFVVVK